MFTSSVQFVHAARIAEELELKSMFLDALKNVTVASIGPTTSETLRNQGVNVDLEPSHPKMGFLVKEAAEKSGELSAKKPHPAIKK
jgi:uroporphyrinogen-III synthase